MTITGSQLLAGFGPPADIAPQDVAALRTTSARRLVVLDDDPTGTQSVADLPVVTGWTVEDLAWAFGTGAGAVYVMTNSRSLGPAEAGARTAAAVRAALEAGRRAGVEVDVVSRSDSTLRGHFPLETDVVVECLRDAGVRVDAVTVVPAFPDAGRITVGGVHYTGGDPYVPVGESEFSADATFGYRSSDLRDWVEEKSGGRYRAGDVVVIGLDLLRGDGPERVAAELRRLSGAQPVVVDAADEADLRTFAAGVILAERDGTRLVHRVGPPFVRALLGQGPRAPLTAGEVADIRRGGLTADGSHGLVVVGSHVGLTTRQLGVLRERHAPHEVEVDVAEVLTDRCHRHVAEVAQEAVEHLGRRHVVVRTSRVLVKDADGDRSLAIAREVSAAVVAVVQQVLAARAPAFVLAKGGITSSDVASHGLGIRRAIARGPMLPGVVSLWEPVDGPARGIPYIVFAGNVGDDGSLAEVVTALGG